MYLKYNHKKGKIGKIYWHRSSVKFTLEAELGKPHLPKHLRGCIRTTLLVVVLLVLLVLLATNNRGTTKRKKYIQC